MYLNTTPSCVSTRSLLKSSCSQITLHKSEMMAPLAESEADIILNKANVALACSQTLISSWLPPKSEAEISQTKTHEELVREDEIFAPVPEK